MNEGSSGITASGYNSLMQQTQWTTRETALVPDKWLIHLGVNDADQGVTASAYKTNMQTIINNLINSYEQLVLIFLLLILFIFKTTLSQIHWNKPICRKLTV